MTIVDFFKVEVKYSGDISDYTKEQLKAMAMARVDKGVDPFDYSMEYEDDDAIKIDGAYRFIDNPCNKLVSVEWAEIREEV